MADDSTAQGVLDVTTTSPCTLFQTLLLDMRAEYHAIPYREWFSTYSTGRHGCADTDMLGGDVAGVGDVHLRFADGASLVLCDVRHVPTMTQSLVSIAQLRDDGYAFLHTEHSWRLHRGLLVVARGARSSTNFPIYPSYIRAGAVYVVALPCREVETRRVSFQDAFSCHVIDTEPEVQCLSCERHIESSHSSMVALQGQSPIVVTDLAIAPETDASFYDVSDPFEVERLCSSEAQRDPSSDTMTEMVCIGADLSVMHTCLGADSSVMQPFMPWPVVQTVVPQGQLSLCDEVTTVVGDLYLDEPVIESFTYMLMPVEADAVLELVCASDTEDSGLADTLGVHAMCEEHGGLIESETVVCHVDPPEVEDCREWILESDLTEVVSLAEIATVASAFGILMCDLLVSRPDLAAAVGAFAVGVVSRLVTDIGIEHGGAMQVITGYLQDVRACSSRDTHVWLLLERIQMHAYSLTESVGIG